MMADLCITEIPRLEDGIVKVKCTGTMNRKGLHIRQEIFFITYCMLFLEDMWKPLVNESLLLFFCLFIIF